jgi:phospholipid-binding lipoprotein MlaA
MFTKQLVVTFRSTLVGGIVLLLTLSTSVSFASDDPFESYNRPIEQLNMGVDHGVLKPLTQGYMTLIPHPLRIAGSNFVNNLQEPVTILNDALQGKLSQSIQDSARFVFNSTLGLFGLIDIATPMGLQRHDEDFGQTFAVWGWKESVYVNLPLLGPSTLRDSLAKPLSLAMTNFGIPFTSLRVLSTRESLMPLEPMLETTPDRYTFIRDSFLQQRSYLINDGKTVQENPFKEFDFSD